MNRQFTMVICQQLILKVEVDIYSNKAVKHLTRLTQHVPQNKAYVSLCYLLASYKWKDFGTTYMINLCVDHFTYRVIRLGAGGLGIHEHTHEKEHIDRS